MSAILLSGRGMSAGHAKRSRYNSPAAATGFPNGHALAESLDVSIDKMVTDDPAVLIDHAGPGVPPSAAAMATAAAQLEAVLQAAINRLNAVLGAGPFAAVGAVAANANTVARVADWEVQRAAAVAADAAAWNAFVALPENDAAYRDLDAASAFLGAPGTIPGYVLHIIHNAPDNVHLVKTTNRDASVARGDIVVQISRPAVIRATTNAHHDLGLANLRLAGGPVGPAGYAINAVGAALRADWMHNLVYTGVVTSVMGRAHPTQYGPVHPGAVGGGTVDVYRAVTSSSGALVVNNTGSEHIAPGTMVMLAAEDDATYSGNLVVKPVRFVPDAAGVPQLKGVRGIELGISMTFGEPGKHFTVAT